MFTIHAKECVAIKRRSGVCLNVGAWDGTPGGFADLIGGVDERLPGAELVIGKPTTRARLRVAIAALLGESAPAFDPNVQ